MNKLKAEVTSCSIEPDALLFHGSEMLDKLHWPTDRLVKDLVDRVEKYIRKIITKPDVFFIFDRYMPGSIKSDTRDARVGAFRRSPHLLLNRELPPKNMCLYSTTTKQNLIDLISGELCDRFANNASSKRLVITSKSSAPEEIPCGVIIKRQDLILYYNEADYMIPQQLSSIIDEKKQAVIKVFFDDGRVCVALLTLQENQLVIDKTVYGCLRRRNKVDKHQQISCCKRKCYLIYDCSTCFT